MLADVVAVIGTAGHRVRGDRPMSEHRTRRKTSVLVAARPRRDRPLGGEVPAGAQAFGGDFGAARGPAREQRLPDAGADGRGRRVPRPAADPGVRGRELLLDVRDEALRPAPHLGVHQHLLHALRRRGDPRRTSRRASASRWERARPDGRIFLKQEEECLAACNGAPMMMVDHVYHENLTPETVDRILDEHK